MADKIVLDVKEEVDRIRSNTKNLSFKKVFWQIDAGACVTMNNDVFVYEFIEFSGGINIFSDLKATYAQVAREEVIERNPDIIILAATTSSGSEEAEYWSRFKDMAAVKNNAVFVVDPYKVSQPTPLKFLEGLKEIVSLVHPEVIHKGTSSR